MTNVLVPTQRNSVDNVVFALDFSKAFDTVRHATLIIIIIIIIIITPLFQTQLTIRNYINKLPRKTAQLQLNTKNQL